MVELHLFQNLSHQNSKSPSFSGKRTGVTVQYTRLGPAYQDNLSLMVLVIGIWTQLGGSGLRQCEYDCGSLETGDCSPQVVPSSSVSPRKSDSTLYKQQVSPPSHDTLKLSLKSSGRSVSARQPLNIVSDWRESRHDTMYLSSLLTNTLRDHLLLFYSTPSW